MARSPSAATAALLARAVACLEAGDVAQAQRLLDSVLAQAPRLPDAIFLRGELRRRAGDWDAALACYRQLLAAGVRHAGVYVARGLAHRGRGDMDEALSCFERAAQLAPDHAEAHGNLARQLAEAGLLARAVQHGSRALALAPANTGLRCNLAVLALRARDAGLAWRCLIDEAPDDFDPPRDLLLGLGAQLLDLDDHDRARTLHAQLVLRDPADADALNGLGQALYRAGDYAAARDAFAALARVAPADVRGPYHLGACHRVLGQHDAARAALAHAATLLHAASPRDLRQRIELELAFDALAADEFEAGWQHYAARWYAVDPNPEDALREYLWRGEDLRGHRLVIAREQGVGDEIMFASLYAELAAQADALVIQCSSRLAAAFARSFPTAECWPCRERPESWTELLPRLAPGDRVVFAGTAPRWLRPHRKAFGPGDAFLVPDTVAVRDWRARLAARGRGPRIGLSWRGGTGANFRGLRSMPLAPLLAALRRELPPDSVLVDLQYDEQGAEIAACEREFGLSLHRFDVTRTDFAATIDLVAALDLVITVQTAVAHVGGALGVPTWVMLPHAPTSVRWLGQDGRTPWYRSVRLFEQQEAGDWASALAAVAHTLRAAAGAGL